MDAASLIAISLLLLLALAIWITLLFVREKKSQRKNYPDAD